MEKNIMEKKWICIGDILDASGISSNSGFYAGRSVEYGDITAKKLAIVSKNILKHLGKQKQAVFNQMVLDLPTLKPSFFIDFVLRIDRMEEDGEWWWDKERLLKHYSGYYNQDLLNMPVCNTTEQIKREFKEQIKRGI